MRRILSEKSQIYILLVLGLWCCHGQDKARVHGLLLRRSHSQRPSPSASLLPTRSNKTDSGWWANDSRRGRPHRQSASSDGDDEKAESTTSEELASLSNTRNRIPIIGWVIPFWNHVRIRSVLMAIHLVLRFELERPVLSSLPPNVLMFLVRTCIQAQARPKVLRIVALELDERLRSELKRYTGNENYEFGDLTKTAIRHYTGNEKYEFGDLTKTTVRNYTGKDQYEFGDLTKTTVKKYTSKDQYEFGDLTRTTLKKFMKAKENYEFGDITKAVVGKLTGREEQVAAYKFGDISRAILTKVSGKEKYQFGDITRGLLRQMQAEEGAKKNGVSKNYLNDVERQLEIVNEMRQEFSNRTCPILKMMMPTDSPSIIRMNSNPVLRINAIVREANLDHKFADL